MLSSVHLDISKEEWEARAERLQLLQIPTSHLATGLITTII